MKKMKNSENASSGVGFGGLLCIAFIVLKLCGVISWSWWWITSPIWIPIAIVIAIFIVWICTKLPSAYRKNKREREIKKIIKEEGLNWFTASVEYAKRHKAAVPRTKWQDRQELMKKLKN